MKKLHNLVWFYRFINKSLKRKTKITLIFFLIASTIVALLESKAVVLSSKIINYSGNLIEANSPLILLFFFTTLISVIRILIIYIQSRLTTYIGSDFARKSAFNFVNSTSMDQLRFQSSIRLSVLTTLMGRIQGGLINPILLISNCIITIIGITYGLLTQKSQLPFISLLILGVVYIFIYKNNQQNINNLTSKFTANILNYTEYAEIISQDILQLKGSQSEQTFANKYSEAFNKYISDAQKRGFIQSYPKFAIEFTAFGGTLLVCWITSLLDLSIAPKFIVGNLLPAGYAGYRLLPIFQQLNYQLSLISASDKELKYNFQFLDLNQEKDVDLQTANTSPIPKISINNLSVTLMDKSKKLRSNIKYKNFEFEIGVNLIRGPSGCGKSTLLKLISGFNTQFQGQIIFDSINGFSENKTVSFVDGEPFVINDSFLNNISLYKKYNIKKINEVVKVVCLDTLINARSLNGNLYKDGELTISQGQRQRLGLARILLKKSKVVCIDEIFSGIDTLTAKKIITNMKLYLPDTIFILIGHQEFLKSSADKVLEL